MSRKYTKPHHNMKKFFKYFFALVMLISASMAFVSCSNDDDPNSPTTGNIVGTWVSTETETQGSVTWTKTMTLCFKANGTGYRQTEEKASTGATNSSMYNFHYTVLTQQNGTLNITIVDDDDNNMIKWEAQQTGNTLLIGTRSYKRK